MAFPFICSYPRTGGDCTTSSAACLESPCKNNLVAFGELRMYPACRQSSSNLAMYSSIRPSFILSGSRLLECCRQLGRVVQPLLLHRVPIPQRHPLSCMKG